MCGPRWRCPLEAPGFRALSGYEPARHRTASKPRADAFNGRPVAFIALTPFAIAGEFNVFVECLGREPLVATGFLLGSCCVAVVYNARGLSNPGPTSVKNGDVHWRC